MTTSRREFLQITATGALLASCSSLRPSAPQQKKRILVLGGTGFLGPALVRCALEHGHTVTLFNRGKTRPGLFPEVEKLQGDRDPKKGEGLAALARRQWDVVFDDCGYYPRHVRASAELLAPSVGQYVYVSSISCYAKNDVENGDENAALAQLADPTVESMGEGYANYGGLKVLCEQAAETAMPGRVTVVRPGYIVGPDDPTGRFTYWPVRFDKGGDVLVPGGAADPIQVIDVRDLAAWMLRCGEQGITGRFNACGPEKRLSWGSVVEACRKCASQPSKVHWVTLEELSALKTDVEGFPIWAPYAGDSKGFHTWSNARAVAAGLRFRPIEEIARDTLAWWKSLADDDKRKHLAGPSAEKEAEALKALQKI